MMVKWSPARLQLGRRQARDGQPEGRRAADFTQCALAAHIGRLSLGSSRSRVQAANDGARLPSNWTGASATVSIWGCRGVAGCGRVRQSQARAERFVLPIDGLW